MIAHLSGKRRYPRQHRHAAAQRHPRSGPWPAISRCLELGKPDESLLYVMADERQENVTFAFT